MDSYIIVKIEPSKELSRILGFPHFIERRFSVKELLEKKMINQADLVEMMKGKEIHKLWEVTS